MQISNPLKVCDKVYVYFLSGSFWISSLTLVFEISQLIVLICDF